MLEIIPISRNPVRTMRCKFPYLFLAGLLIRPYNVARRFLDTSLVISPLLSSLTRQRPVPVAGKFQSRPIAVAYHRSLAVNTLAVPIFPDLEKHSNCYNF